MKNSILMTSLVVSSILLSACDSGSATSNPQRKPVSVLDGKATISLPPEYVKMPQELLNVKYPIVEKRPSEAWYVESEGGKVTFAFSLTQTKLPEAQVPRLAGMLKLQMSMFSPTTTDMTINGKKMSRLEMTTPSADGNIFNVMQISSMNEKMMISTFNVTSDLKDKYTAAGKEALSTLTY